MKSAFPPVVICNPRAGGGRAGRLWPGIERGLRATLGPIDICLPDSPGATATAAAGAAREGRALVIVGGDGTLNAAIAGLGPGLDAGLEAGLPAPPLALVSAGSGGDFARAFGLAPGALDSARALAEGRLVPTDLGRIDLADATGATLRRWFLSVANTGLSARVVQAMQGSRLPALIGPKLAYIPFVLRELARETGTALMLTPEDGPALHTRALVVSVANTRHFAAGMTIAPGARADDGLFDVIVIRADAGIRPWDLRHLYTGRILSHPAVTHLRTRSLTLAAADGRALPCDADGELMGLLPGRFTCLAGVLPLALPGAARPK